MFLKKEGTMFDVRGTSFAAKILKAFCTQTGTLQR